MGKKVLKYVGMVVAVLVIFFIGAGVGNSGAKVELNDKKMNATQLDKKIDSLKDELKKQKDELAKQKDKNKDVFAMIDKKDEIKKELDDTQTKLSDAKKTLNDTQSQVDGKKKELARLTGEVIQAKSQPKILNAGMYTVGKDIPEGRYKVVPAGEDCNFFVFNEEGEAIVNTILGGGEFESSYTFETSNGNKIQTESTVKLIPVE